MTPAITDAFQRIRQECGQTSISRVDLMLNPRTQGRHSAQKGAKWILPGISQRAWHDPYAYPEFVHAIATLESYSPQIKKEFKRVWDARGTEFGSYKHYLGEKKDWKAFYLYRKGNLVPSAECLFPVAFQTLSNSFVSAGKICPLLESHFSTLLPGAAIAPHCDLWNFSINLHLALDIPPNCGIRVAGEERTWTEGKCLLFDYSFMHEAWNHSDRPRTCLLVDLWHPEVTHPERRALVVLITELRKMLGEE